MMIQKVMCFPFSTQVLEDKFHVNSSQVLRRHLWLSNYQKKRKRCRIFRLIQGIFSLFSESSYPHSKRDKLAINGTDPIGIFVICWYILVPNLNKI